MENDKVVFGGERIVDKELISVIVPVYNVEQYVQRCVKSIIEQTYTNLQIILVDDGSTDGSGVKCDELALLDERIETIHKENGGLADARNEGICHARGEYVGFVDSDDYIEQDMYETLYASIIMNRADFVSCGYFEEFQDAVSIKCSSPKIKVLDKRGAYMELYSRDGSLGCSSCCKLFRSRLFDSVRYKKGILSEDLDLIYRMIDISNLIVCVNATKYHYVHRENSITTSLSDTHITDVILIFENMISFIEKKYPEVLKMAYAYRLSWMIGIYKSVYKSRKSGYQELEKKVRKVLYKDIEHYRNNEYVYWADRLLLMAAIVHIFGMVNLVLGKGVVLYHKLKRHLGQHEF